jgi:hypothetical protein
MTSDQLRAGAAATAEANKELLKQIPQWDDTALGVVGAVALAGVALTYVAARKGGQAAAVPTGILSLSALGLTYVVAAPPPPPWEKPAPPKTGLQGIIETPVKTVQTETADVKAVMIAAGVTVPIVAAYLIFKNTQARR